MEKGRPPHIANEYMLIRGFLCSATHEKKDFVAIIGKSSSGKSTLMHILGLLDSPTSGEIILNGKNTTKYNERNWLG